MLSLNTFIPFSHVSLSVPDRHSGASAEVQKEEEKKFKEVGEAFTVLSDPKKKSRYDSGHDLEDDDMNMGECPSHQMHEQIHKRLCLFGQILVSFSIRYLEPAIHLNL